MMKRMLTSTLAVLSLASGSMAAAQSAAPLSLSNAPVTARAGADMSDAGQLDGTGKWIVVALALGLVVWGIIELSKDSDPASP